MSNLRKFKSWFIEEVPRPKQEPSQLDTPAKATTPKQQSASTKPATQQTAAAQHTAAQNGKISERFTDVLLDAMEAANQPGFDYLEFKKALENLKAMNLDDSTRFKSAYAMAQSMNVSSAQLVQSARHYLSVLSEEDRKFQVALQGQEQLQIQGRKEKAKQLEQEMAHIEAEIAQLKARMQAIQEQQDQLTNELSDAATKIAATQADFQHTYQTIAQQIQHDVQQMETFLT